MWAKSNVARFLVAWPAFLVTIFLTLTAVAHENGSETGSGMSLRTLTDTERVVLGKQFEWHMRGVFNAQNKRVIGRGSSSQYSIRLPDRSEFVVRFDEMPGFNLWQLRGQAVIVHGDFSGDTERLAHNQTAVNVFVARIIERALPDAADKLAYGPAEHVAGDEYWALLARNNAAPQKQPTRVPNDPALRGSIGEWGPELGWPHVAVTAANLTDGRVLTFASNMIDGFPSGQPEFTHAAIWDPATGDFETGSAINHPNHDMFCGHPVLLDDGRFYLMGGRNTVRLTSIFDVDAGTWVAGDQMTDPRWYPSAIAMPDNTVFIAVGSGGSAYPELWTEGQGWDRLNGINLQNPILNYSGHYERNWWPYWHIKSDGTLLHSGPTPVMHAIDPVNETISALGPRLTSGDWYPKHGVSVAYDEQKVLIAGGATAGGNQTSTNKALIMDISGAAPVVTPIEPMLHARKFANVVMQPDGKALVIGGNTSGMKFNDSGWVAPAEVFDPAAANDFNPATLPNPWTELADMSVPRTYHSIALLLVDGRVLSAGSGLCGTGCGANHQDAQVFSPPYLFNADGTPATRPALSVAPQIIGQGHTYLVQASTGIDYFSLVKLSSTTHAVNTDQRYLRLPHTDLGGGIYEISTQSDPGHPYIDNPNVLTGGMYMMFAVNQQGTPSLAKIIRVVTGSSPSNTAPVITDPGYQLSILGELISFQIEAFDPELNPLLYSAAGLPAGMSIDAFSGEISGYAGASGTFNVTITVDDQNGEAPQMSFAWTIATAGPIPNLAGAWDFDGSAASGDGSNDGTLNGATFINDAERGQVLSCDGNNDYVEIDNTTTPSFSFATWIWTDQASSTGDSAAAGDALVASNVSGEGDEFIFAILNNRLAFLDGGNAITTVGNTAVTDGQWHHVAFTRVAGGQVTLYVDGYPDGGGPAGSGALTENPATTICANVVGSNFYGGLLDDLRQFNRGLSAAEIAELALGSGSLPDPLSVGAIVSLPQRKTTQLNFTAQASGGLSLTYSWLFGDGTPPTLASTSPSISHTYADAGRYQASLTVSSITGEDVTVEFLQAIHEPLTAGKPTMSSTLLYETRAGNDRIWNVNPDNGTVSAFDTVTDAKLAEIAVGAKPRALAQAPDGRIWVLNKDSSTIKVIDPTTLGVVDTYTVARGAQPAGLVFGPTDGYAYVTLEATGELLRLDAANGQLPSTLDVGPRPRHLALSADGARLLVARFVTPPQPGESEGAPLTEQGGDPLGGEVLVIDTATFAVLDTIVLQNSDHQDSEHAARGIPNYLGVPAISPDGLSAWVASKQDNMQRGVFRDGNQLTHDSSVRSIASRIDLADGSEDYPARHDHDDGGVASTALFGPYGIYLFTALEGSREIAVIDAHSRPTRELFRIPVGNAPQGLALSADGMTLYVHNFLDRTISAHDLGDLLSSGDLSASLTASYAAVANETLTAQVLHGKRLFYDARDPRLALQQYISCAGCHNDGGGDGRVWDITGFGEGLRNTIDLQGRAGMGHGMLHWSANFDEVQDFEGQIRDLSGGTGLMDDAAFHFGTRDEPLGLAKAGISADLDALAAYVASLDTFDRSPHRNPDDTLTVQAQAGLLAFQTLGCASCHNGAALTDSPLGQSHDIGTIDAASGQRLNGPLSALDTPTLRGLWSGAPYLHDGSAGNLATAIGAHTGVGATAQQVDDLAVYLAQIDGLTPDDNLAPDVPADVSGTTLGVDSIEVSWAASGDGNGVGVEGYTIYRDGLEIAQTSATTLTDTGLAPDTTYSYEISAFDYNDNVSLPSAPLDVDTDPLPDTTAPNPPVFVSAIATGPRTTTLDWAETLDSGGSGLADYTLLRDDVEIATLTALTYDDTGLEPETTYAYRLRATDNAGNVSDLSAPLEVTTGPLPDTDGDGVPDELDNCTLLANADQRDTNGDGYGNLCDADLNDDGVVNPTDLGLLAAVFFTADPDADFNGDGIVNPSDLGILKSQFFGPPGPSGLN